MAENRKKAWSVSEPIDVKPRGQASYRIYPADSFDDLGLRLKEQGIEACRVALLKKSKNVLDGNFIEGMACIGGCIGGAGCLTHGEKNKAQVDEYGREALEKTISDAVSILK